jgi:cytochrome c oxidase assembly protein Cox11
VVVVLGASYAAVPLYRIFCQVRYVRCLRHLLNFSMA